MKVLGIESSCDETSVACVDSDGVRANLISSQVDLHEPFGGVVPEIASRAHVSNALIVLDAALERAGWELTDLELIAATAGPGLIGAVLTGMTFGKTLAWSLGVDFVGVHHIEGHILANDIEERMQLPAVVLVVSGGHTETILVDEIGSYRRLGSTRDDAAGETFDKSAKLMGLPYPGGPQIQNLALEGDAHRFDLPRALMRRGDLDFSFSGLKTAVRLRLESIAPEDLDRSRADLAASLQSAVVDVLVAKTERALDAVASLEPRGLYLAGGVAANGPLREGFAELACRRRLHFRPPPLAYCTDNAAMIAWAGRHRWARRGPDPLSMPAFARFALDRWSAESA
jgi:N6-L-threonylcarbamoyladenine synthase